MRFKTVLLAATVGAFFSANVQAAQPDTSVQGVLKALGASPGGVGFVLLSAMSKVVKDAYPRLEITVVPGGFVGNIPRVNAGESDIGATTVSLAAMAETKTAPFDKGDLPNAMALFNVQNKFNFFAVMRADSEIDSIADLFAKKLPVRLATLNKGSATELVWRAMFASQGVAWDDISGKWGGSLSFVTWADAVNLMKDGHADGILAVGSDKIGWLLELANARDVKILKWDEEFLKLAQDKFGLARGMIPANTYPGVEGEVVVPFTPCEVVINGKTEDKVVEAILTALADNPKAYGAFHPDLSKFTKEGMGKGMKLPLHPAAKAFYEKRGIPTQ